MELYLHRLTLHSRYGAPIYLYLARAVNLDSMKVRPHPHTSVSTRMDYV
jgi:hypothetical protein